MSRAFASSTSKQAEARVVETRSSESLFKSEITLLLSSGGGGGWFAYRTLSFFINRGGEGRGEERRGSRLLILWRGEDFFFGKFGVAKFCDC